MDDESTDCENRIGNKSRQDINRNSSPGPLLLDVSKNSSLTVIQLTPATPSSPTPPTLTQAGEANVDEENENVIDSDISQPQQKLLRNQNLKDNDKNSKLPQAQGTRGPISRYEAGKFDTDDSSNKRRTFRDHESATIDQLVSSDEQRDLLRSSKHTHSMSVIDQGSNQVGGLSYSRSTRHSDNPIERARRIWKKGGRNLVKSLRSGSEHKQSVRASSQGNILDLVDRPNPCFLDAISSTKETNRIENIRESSHLGDMRPKYAPRPWIQRSYDIQGRVNSEPLNENDYDYSARSCRTTKGRASSCQHDIPSGSSNILNAVRSNRNKNPSNALDDINNLLAKSEQHDFCTNKQPQFNGSSRCILNVGGVRHETLWSTLLKMPKTRLWRLAYTVCYLFRHRQAQNQTVIEDKPSNASKSSNNKPCEVTKSSACSSSSWSMEKHSGSDHSIDVSGRKDESSTIVSTTNRGPVVGQVLKKSILKYCDDFNLNTNEFYFDRQPRSFSSIIDYYRTGKLHLPDELCVISYKDDLDYWQIEDYNLDSCCQQRYHQRRDNVFEEMKKEMESLQEHDEELFGTDKIERYKKFVWDLLEKPQTSLAARVS